MGEKLVIVGATGPARFHGDGISGPTPSPSPLTRNPRFQKFDGTIGSPTETFSGKMNSNTGASYWPVKRPFAPGARSRHCPVRLGLASCSAAAPVVTRLTVYGLHIWRATTRTMRPGVTMIPFGGLIARMRARPGCGPSNCVVIPPPIGVVLTVDAAVSFVQVGPLRTASEHGAVVFTRNGLFVGPPTIESGVIQRLDSTPVTGSLSTR